MMTNAHRDMQADSNKKIKTYQQQTDLKTNSTEDRIKTISNKDKEIQTKILRHNQIDTMIDKLNTDIRDIDKQRSS